MRRASCKQSTIDRNKPSFSGVFKSYGSVNTRLLYANARPNIPHVVHSEDSPESAAVSHHHTSRSNSSTLSLHTPYCPAVLPPSNKTVPWQSLSTADSIDSNPSAHHFHQSLSHRRLGRTLGQERPKRPSLQTRPGPTFLGLELQEIVLAEARPRRPFSPSRRKQWIGKR
jgi:hypothetical protein